MRPDTSQDRGTRANRPGVASVRKRLAMVGDQPACGGRSARPGEGVSGLAQYLAAARREIAVPENTPSKSLAFAREAPTGRDFRGALECLGVVESVDGVLPLGGEQTREVWCRGGLPAEAGHGVSAAPAEAGGPGEGAV